MAKILVINGPNLNLLGTREPQLYGTQSLDEINSELKKEAAKKGHDIGFFQSNHEGALIDKVHEACGKIDIIILNAGAYSHTSLALRDALLAVKIPFIRVHLSNVYNREPVRQHSYLNDIALGVIGGFGSLSYRLALEAAILYSETRK